MSEPFWKSINPDTVVCAAGGCRAPAVPDLDDEGRPASDPWGWRCKDHPASHHPDAIPCMPFSVARNVRLETT